MLAVILRPKTVLDFWTPPLPQHLADSRKEKVSPDIQLSVITLRLPPQPQPHVGNMMFIERPHQSTASSK